jgi:sugar phosphate isomerase/epimerase
MKRHGYTAAYCPNAIMRKPTDEKLAADFVAAAKANNLVIAEVGAWSNPISPDENERKKALALCQQRLAIAEMVGARCCVNIAGSRGRQWDGPHPANFSRETFDMIVQSVRTIIDAVKPTRTFYALETIAWIFPDAPDNYLQLIKAIDRKACAAHLDPVNLISSPRRSFDNAALIRECFEKLGPYIRSCHAKDSILHSRLTVHIDEARPGTGNLDYATYLRELSKIDPDTPLMIEHLSSEEDYRQAAHHIRAVAEKEGLKFI